MAEDKKGKERNLGKKDRFEILLEDMNGKIDMMLEGREITDNKIDRLEQKVDKNKEELVEMIKFSNKVLHEKIDKVEVKLTQEIKNVEVKLGQRIDKVEQEVKEINHKLDKVIIRQDRQEERQDKQEAKIETFVHSTH